MDNTELFEETKASLVAMIKSSQDYIYLHEVPKRYEMFTQKKLPYRELGFSNAISLYDKMSDAVSLHGTGKGLILIAASDNVTAHVERLVKDHKLAQNLKFGFNQQPRPYAYNPNVPPIMPLLVPSPFHNGMWCMVPTQPPAFNWPPSNATTFYQPRFAPPAHTPSVSHVKMNIRKILKKHPEGLSFAKLQDIYFSDYGLNLHPQIYGFPAWEDFIHAIGDVAKLLVTGDTIIVISSEANLSKINSVSVEFEEANSNNSSSKLAEDHPTNSKTFDKTADAKVENNSEWNIDNFKLALKEIINDHPEGVPVDILWIKYCANFGNLLCHLKEFNYENMLKVIKEIPGVEFLPKTAQRFEDIVVPCLQNVADKLSTNQTDKRLKGGVNDVSETEKTCIQECDQELLRKLLQLACSTNRGINIKSFSYTYKYFHDEELQLPSSFGCDLKAFFTQLKDFFEIINDNNGKIMVKATGLGKKWLQNSIANFQMPVYKVNRTVEQPANVAEDAVIVSSPLPIKTFEDVKEPVSATLDIDVDAMKVSTPLVNEAFEDVARPLPESVNIDDDAAKDSAFKPDETFKETSGSFIGIVEIAADAETALTCAFESPLSLEVAVGSCCDVYITCVSHPGAFYFRLIHHQLKLEELQREMSNLYDDPLFSYHYFVPLKYIKTGLTCATYSSEEKTWKRCIVWIYNNCDSIDVGFIDDGNKATVGAAKLRFLKKQYISIPSLCYQAKLTNVKGTNGGRWTQPAKRRFENLCLHKMLNVQFENVENPASLSFNNEFGANKLSIIDLLQSEGLGVKILSKKLEIMETINPTLDDEVSVAVTLNVEPMLETMPIRNGCNRVTDFELNNLINEMNEDYLQPDDISNVEEQNSVTRPTTVDIRTVFTPSIEKDDSSNFGEETNVIKHYDFGHQSHLDCAPVLQGYENLNDLYQILPLKLSGKIIHIIWLCGVNYIQSIEVSRLFWKADILNEMVSSVLKIKLKYVNVDVTTYPNLYEELLNTFGNPLTREFHLIPLKMLPDILERIAPRYKDTLKAFHDLTSMFI